MSTAPAATQGPTRPGWADRWRPSVSEFSIASDAAPRPISSASAHAPAAGASSPRRSGTSQASATPAASPAGTQAASTRSRGWASAAASRSSSS
jgi:hypothetical protein